MLYATLTLVQTVGGYRPWQKKVVLASPGEDAPEVPNDDGSNVQVRCQIDLASYAYTADAVTTAAAHRASRQHIARREY